MRGGYCERAGVNRTAGRFFVNLTAVDICRKNTGGTAYER